jgi:4,4'-diaponeurosporenoate glycosyltransferase
VATGPAAALYVAYAAQLGWMLRRVGRFGWATAAAYPVPLAFFLAVFARSVALTKIRRQVTWRGRAVPIGRR